MHKQLPSWRFISENCQQDIPVMFLYVIESKGSSPGRQGFMMAVNANGQIIGSLGGGIMEHKFVELAKSKLLQRQNEVSVHEQLHDKVSAKNQSGMICSGGQTILMYTVRDTDLIAVGDLIHSLEENKNGTLQLSQKGIQFFDVIPTVDFDLETTGEEDFRYTEKTGYRNVLYIIGAGHCALALSKLVSVLDFYIYLVDDRAGLPTMEQNQFVHQKKVIDDFHIVADLIPDGNNIFVVIMTVGYRTDDIVLRSLMNKKIQYLGILGSKHKIAKMFRDLETDGIPSTVLDEIHAPIGVSIKSQSPEEIAVSITAEIIQVKNKNLV